MTWPRLQFSRSSLSRRQKVFRWVTSFSRHVCCTARCMCRLHDTRISRYRDMRYRYDVSHDLNFVYPTVLLFQFIGWVNNKGGEGVFVTYGRRGLGKYRGSLFFFGGGIIFPLSFQCNLSWLLGRKQKFFSLLHWFHCMNFLSKRMNKEISLFSFYVIDTRAIATLEQRFRPLDHFHSSPPHHSRLSACN